MFTIKLDSIDEINVILTGLGQLPLSQSLDVFSKVRAQAAAQAAAVTAAPTPTETNG